MSSSINKIDYALAKEIIDTTPNLMLLDVREEEEYILGHIENAILFPVDSIDESSSKLLIKDLDTPLMVYCKSGSRATDAASKLGMLGYKTIYNLGGVIGWPYGLEV